MIIWLASYPKSGNTWVRLFLESLLFNQQNLDINNLKITQFPQKYHFSGLIDESHNLFNSLEGLKEISKNCINAQNKVNLDNKIKFLKTHSACWKAYNTQFTNEENTLGVIHIVRDPRNIITSILNHFSKESYSDALEFMNNSAQQIWDESLKDEKILTIISSWANHYNSWKKFKKNNLLIYYEKMLNDPITEFNKISDFLNKIGNFNFEKNKILNAIEKCNFNNLQNIENEQGFKEAPLDKNGLRKKFFHLGPKNDWKKILDNKTILKVEKIFESEMKELKYIE